MRRLSLRSLAGLVLCLAVLSGCQTWEGGMTLPSGRYLDHPPQYFLPDPDFPLQRELATQEEQSGLTRAIPRDIGAGPAGVPGIAPPPLPVPLPVAPVAPVAPVVPPKI